MIAENTPIQELNLFPVPQYTTVGPLDRQWSDVEEFAGEHNAHARGKVVITV